MSARNTTIDAGDCVTDCTPCVARTPVVAGMPRDNGAACEMVICGAAPCDCAAADRLLPPLLLYEPDTLVVNRFDQTDCNCPEYTPPPASLQQICTRSRSRPLVLFAC